METIRQLTVNVSAIAAVIHACRGCATPCGCCCASYEVCITAREMRAIIGVLPYVVDYCPGLKAGNFFDNVFEETEDGLLTIDTDEHGLCVFAYQGDSGIRCALHSAAQRLGIPTFSVKPVACVLWPLALSESSNAYLSICRDALAFACTRPRKGLKRTISPAILQTIGELFGEKARSKVARAAGEGLARISLKPKRLERNPGCKS